MNKVLYVAALMLLPAVWLILALPVGSALEPGSLTPGPDASPLECGLRLDESANGSVALARSVRVAVAFDEEWEGVLGESASVAARGLLVNAAGFFRGLHIHLLPIRVSLWESPDELTSIVEVVAAAQDAIPLDGADVVVVFSAQPVDDEDDGYAEVGGRYAGVVHHPEHPERDLQVIAHEISHLFGAHHGCDVPGLSGLMASAGFDDPSVICPCTRRILEANAHRFHVGSR